MTARRLVLGVGSAALAVFLFFVLVKISKVDLRSVFLELRSVSCVSFAKLAVLNIILVYLSTKKWLSIDATWRRAADTAPSVITSFAHTSIGFVLGLFLPVQLAMSTARALGTHGHGKAVKRGVGGTLYEQGFDLLTVCFLAIASGITRFYHGGGLMWAVSAVVATSLALFVVGPSVRLMRWRRRSRREEIPVSRSRVGAALHHILEVRHSSLIDAALARRLVILSALRFAVVVMMSVLSAEAINVHIPAWQIAAAIPFVVIASVIALTPGGMGVNELTSVTALKIFGTPLAVGAQWAFANRVLVAMSYVLVAAIASLMLGAGRIAARCTRDRKWGSLNEDQEVAVER